MTAPDEMVNVRYMVNDVQAAIDFYTKHFDFELHTSAAPAFADVTRGNLRLLLSGPHSSAGRPMPDGATPGPGGWNRIHLLVDDITSEVARLRDAGLRSRTELSSCGPELRLDSPHEWDQDVVLLVDVQMRVRLQLGDHVLRTSEISHVAIEVQGTWWARSTVLERDLAMLGVRIRARWIRTGSWSSTAAINASRSRHRSTLSPRLSSSATISLLSPRHERLRVTPSAPMFARPDGKDGCAADRTRVGMAGPRTRETGSLRSSGPYTSGWIRNPLVTHCQRS